MSYEEEQYALQRWHFLAEEVRKRLEGLFARLPDFALHKDAMLVAARDPKADVVDVLHAYLDEVERTGRLIVLERYE